MTIKAVTLFSGVGGSSLALDDLGATVLPHDFMPEAVATLRANGFGLAREIDVRKIDWTVPAYVDTDLLEGGPPCQPFSQAHEGDGQYDERDMIPEFLRAIDGLLPKVFVMEEVKTLTWPKHRVYFDMVLDHMRTLGYRVEWRILNAAEYGIGQARKRLFVIGVREDIAQRWEDFGRAPIMWPTKWEASMPTMAEALGWDEETAAARAALAPRAGDHSWVFQKPAPTVVGSYRPEIAAKPGWRKPGDGPRQNTPGSVYTTLEERLVLQDFPADWIVCGSKAKQDLQVGNSVPVGLMREVFEVNLP